MELLTSFFVLVVLPAYVFSVICVLFIANVELVNLYRVCVLKKKRTTDWKLVGKIYLIALMPLGNMTALWCMRRYNVSFVRVTLALC